MKINSIGNCHCLNQKAHNQKFGNAYVTLSEVNCGHEIAKNVDAYNKGDFLKMYYESIYKADKLINSINNPLSGLLKNNHRIKDTNDLVNKVDFFVLAGGSGSRFKHLASAVSDLRGKGEKFNKISVPFELGNGEAPLTMLDIPMAMGRFFAPKKGYEKIIAKTPTGSFGDVINHYLDGKHKIKDVVVCCGDNVFDMKSEDMLDYIVRTINNPDKQLGVVGVARTPEEVAKRFGVLDVGKQYVGSKNYPLNGFVEKPELDAAKKLTTPEGISVANTGMFVIKKDTMEKLIKIIKAEKKVLKGKTTYIAKDFDKEIYDFAAATKWARLINGSKACDVKIVKRWEDVGEPKAYLRWAQQLKLGHYLDNFTPKRKNAILQAVQERVGKNSINFTLVPNGTKPIDGIKISA